MTVRIKENSWIAKLAAAKLKADKVAMVLGNVIHLHNCSRQELLNDRKWLCHELKHVQQFRQYGIGGFLVRYLAEWIRHGYHQNRFEKEARANESNEAMAGQFLII